MQRMPLIAYPTSRAASPRRMSDIAMMLGIGLVWLVGGACGGSGKSKTVVEVTVEVDANLSIDTIGVTASSPFKPRVVELKLPPGPSVKQNIYVSDLGDGAIVSVEARGERRGSTVVIARGRVALAKNKTVLITLRLSKDCEDVVTCDPDQTCDHGMCVTIPLPSVPDGGAPDAAGGGGGRDGTGGAGTGGGLVGSGGAVGAATGGAMAGTGGRGGSGGAAGSGGSGGFGGSGGSGGAATGGAMGTGGGVGTGGSGGGGGFSGTGAVSGSGGGTGGGPPTTPTLIAQYLSRPHFIAVDATHVCYKSESTFVGCARKDGSDLKPFAYPDATAAAYAGTSIGVDSNKVLVVWAPPDAPFRLSTCSISNCDGTIVALGGEYSWYFAVDRIEHRVFWWEPDGFWVSPTTGLASARLPVTSLPAAIPSRFVYSRGNIYFRADNAIYRLPVSISGTPAMPVYVSDAQMEPAAANDSSLFWIDATSIRSIPLPNGLGGGSTQVIDNVAVRNYALVADDVSLYWIASGLVETCRIANCAATRRSLPMPEPDPQAIDVDDRAVYWVTRTEVNMGTGPIIAGKVWRLAK
jgi:hypothetical protein